jgi:hypothetical protein
MKLLRKTIAKILLLSALFGGWAHTAPGQIPGFSFPTSGTEPEIFRDIWNQAVAMVPDVYTRTITTAEAQQIMSLLERYGSGSISDAETLVRELVRMGVFRDFESAFGAVSGADGAASSANAQVVNNVIQNSIFEKAEPAAAGAKAAARSGTVTTVFGADAFYQRTELDGGAKIKGYGTNLSVTWGDKLQLRSTVPLYKTEFGGFDATTYGVDLNGKYRVSDRLAIGAHGNYITNDSSGGDSKSVTAGIYAASSARLNEDSSLTFGVLLDHVKPDGTDGVWLGALGVNWGVRLGRNTAFNPYAIYYHNFDAATGADKSWSDIGGELQFNLSETWAFKTGLKTSLGQDGVDKTYQVYLGSAWRF